MIEEKERREIAEDQISKIRSSVKIDEDVICLSRLRRLSQVSAAIGRTNENPGVREGEDLPAVPQRERDD